MTNDEMAHYIQMRWLRWLIMRHLIWMSHLDLLSCYCVLAPHSVSRVNIFSSPEPKAHGELIVYQSSRRPSVRASVRPHF